MLESKLGKAEREVLDEHSKTVYFHSMHDFLMQHNGLRPGCLHIVLGNSGGGKSTFVRSLIIDVMCNRPRKKILLWLSEESKTEFLTEFIKSEFHDYENEDFFIYSELDNEIEPKKLLTKIEDILIEHDIDVLFFDNITTSALYEGRSHEVQVGVTRLIKKMAAARDIPVIVVAHTGKHITENYQNIINMNDIKGSSTIVNLAQFFYIMQTFQQGDFRFPTIRITKFRSQQMETHIHRLFYAKANRIYSHSAPMSFAEFKNAYQDRNKL